MLKIAPNEGNDLPALTRRFAPPSPEGRGNCANQFLDFDIVGSHRPPYSKTVMKGIVAAFVLLVVILVMGYGYRFGVTHGALNIIVLDVSDREHTRDVKPVQLVFRDASGRVLAGA